MHETMRRFFSPLLKRFESGDSQYNYRPSHRIILKVMGLLFIVLACGSIYLAITAAILGAALPAIVFLSIGLVCQIVAFFGTDRAVANIWKST